MIKNIFLSLLLFCTLGFSQEYSLNHFQSGTPYVRLTIPESTEKFTCFDEKTYRKIGELLVNSSIKDSITLINEDQINLCNQNNIDLQKALQLTKENQTSLEDINKKCMTGYDKCSKDLQNEKFKKYIWSGTTGIIGYIGGILTVLILM